MKEAMGLFFAMSSQWRWASVGLAGAIRVGLDYGALAPAAALSGLTMTPKLFDDIRTMEFAALEVWGKRHG
jgi:hypothetical protein